MINHDYLCLGSGNDSSIDVRSRYPFRSTAKLVSTVGLEKKDVLSGPVLYSKNWFDRFFWFFHKNADNRSSINLAKHERYPK